MTRKVTLARVVLLVAVGLGALCAGPAAARAHPLLITAAPAPGAILPGPPSRLTLEFSEASVPRGSALTLRGPGDVALTLGRLRSGDRGRQLGTSLPRRLKPGVYRVHWVALGDDGHTVSGEFAFGIAEKGGAPPPGAAGIGAIGGGRGGASAGEGTISLAVRWLGLLAASLLWGAALLSAAVGRRPRASAPTHSSLARPLRLALVIAVAAAVWGVVEEARAGAGATLDLGLLTASGSGISALVRAATALVGLAAVLALKTPRRRSRAQALTGLALLASYGLSGHVIAQGSAVAALVMTAHVIAAGTWAGGLLALTLLVRARELAPADGARAFAPLAGAGLAIAATTGAISAIREVGHVYFLWWSGYGRLVIAKVVLVAGASLAGGATALRAAGRPDAGRRSSALRVLGLEAGLLVAVVAVATVLSSFAQGRGQPLPAQRGNLLPGPAFASALLSTGTAPVTLAPARPGANELIVTPPAGARSVTVRLVCSCDVRPVITALRRHGETFSARIPVPTAGTWDTYVSVDGAPARSPVALPVGVSGAPGAPVRSVLAVADLSGPGAARCRSYLVGLELAVGRLNGSGGVDGGDKLAVLALDDAGSASAASAAASAALRGSGSAEPVALAPCGAGSEPAAAQAGRRGIPVLAGDPAAGLVAGRRVFRVAGDPYADGVAIVQAINAEVVPAAAGAARTVAVVSVPDAQGRRRLAGLRATLASVRPELRIAQVPATTIVHARADVLAARLDRARTVALVIDADDEQAPGLAAAIRRLPARGGSFAPAPIITSERVLSESFIDASGDAGRLGVIEGTSTVSVDSHDGLTLSQTIPALFPGERPSLEALRGYVTGLALDDGLAHGTSPAAIAARLARPLPFTDAIPEPWRADAPDAGAQRLGLLEPTFLSSTLIPTSQGGEPYAGEYFSDGAWMRPTSALFGPSLRQPVPAVGGER